MMLGWLLGASGGCGRGTIWVRCADRDRRCSAYGRRLVRSRAWDHKRGKSVGIKEDRRWGRDDLHWVGVRKFYMISWLKGIRYGWHVPMKPNRALCPSSTDLLWLPWVNIRFASSGGNLSGANCWLRCRENRESNTSSSSGLSVLSDFSLLETIAGGIWCGAICLVPSELDARLRCRDVVEWLYRGAMTEPGRTNGIERVEDFRRANERDIDRQWHWALRAKTRRQKIYKSRDCSLTCP